MYVETANFYFENSIRCKFLYRKFPIDWAPCKTVIEIYIGVSAKWPNHVQDTMQQDLDGNVLYCVRCV